MVHSLSKERKDAYITLGPWTLGHRPDIAMRIAAIVSAWSYIEIDLALSLGRLLGTKADVGIKLYRNIQNDGAKETAIHTAAEAELVGADLKLFRAILRLTKQAYTSRNLFAHNLWGYSRDVPDKALLVPAKTLLDYEATPEMLALDPDVIGRHRRIPRASIRVYSVKDLDRILNQIVNANRMLVWFWRMRAEPKSKRALHRQRLSREPDMQRVLQKPQPHHRKKRKSPRRSHPQVIALEP